MVDALVIIPTYNEIENIERIIHSVFSQDASLDILIVDDNSPDGTADKVLQLQNKYKNRLYLEKRQGKQGLGTAYIHGFKWSLSRNYQYIFEMDADFSHNPKDLPRLYETCRQENVDLVVGSRYITGVNVVNWPMSRVLLSWGASKYVQFITGMDVQDTTAGYVCYHRNVLEKINLDKIKFVGYAFQIEMKFKSYLLGFNIKEIPVIFTDRTQGKSKMSGAIISEAIWGVLRMKIKSLFKRYEI